jgi:hypothetical protein
MYDTVFKRLMENERMVRTFIGTILGKPVEKLRIGHGETGWLEPQEDIIVVQANKNNYPLAMWRCGYDFTALVRTDDDYAETSIYEEMPITIQKYGPHATDDHFLDGLTEQYKDRSDPPATSIYVLGFILPGLESACVNTGYNCEDLVNEKPLIEDSSFLRLLLSCEWDSFVIQTQRIVAGRSQTELDKLLGIFEQRDFVANGWNNDKILKRYRHSVDNEDLREIVDFLHYLATDPDERKLIENEHECWRSFNVQLEAAIKERVKKRIKNKS